MTDRKGSVVTFYSYKGGVGRTLALANIAALLSRWGFHVLCIDWDLEAPGLHLYFKNSLPPDGGYSGLVELVDASIVAPNLDWRSFITPIYLPQSTGPLDLILAGRQDDSYVERMQRLDWGRLYAESEMGAFLERLRQDWKQNYDFILIDSRTGITDIGGICTVQLPDLLVLLFTANDQSLYGSLDTVRRAERVRRDLPVDRAKLLTLPVVTRFEVRREYALAQEWLEIFARELAPIFADWMPRSLTPEDLLNYTRLPYIPYWSFGEKLPVVEKGTSDPEDLGYALETLCALIVQKFASADVLVRNRDAYVNAARQGAESGTDPATGTRTPHLSRARMFLSYSHRDLRLVEELRKHLAGLRRRGILEETADRAIAPGSNWDEEIHAKLEEADIILLLISADFLASEYLYGREMKRALERHAEGSATVVPIILRPVVWEDSPLMNLQVLPPGARPVTTWPDQDEAWTEIARELRRLIEKRMGEAL
jgi:cellulose biosynthesis protein BcsQ